MMSNYYTVGIVEDEIIERRALRLILQKNRPALQVVFEAGDGNSALELARSYTPDILIVDIQIPERPGLEVCRMLRQEGYKGLIVISTSYSLFRYAYEAIKLEVVDYLLKPTEEAQILSVLDRCIAILEQDQQAKEKEERLLDHIHQAKHDADLHFTDRLLAGDVHLIPRLTEMGVPEDGRWQAVWISIALPPKLSQESQPALHTSICQTFQGVFFVFVRLKEHSALIFLQPQMHCELHHLYALLRCFLWDLKRLTGQSAPCYVSPVCASLSEIKEAGATVPDDLSSLKLTRGDFIANICFDQAPRAFSRDQYAFHLHKLLRLIQDNRLKYLESLLFTELQEYAKTSLPKAWAYLRIFADALVSFSEEWDLTPLASRISNPEFLSDPDLLRETIQQTLEGRTSSSEESADTSLEQILQIMRTEYASNLSQSEVAQRVGMTQAYFSRMFKNKIGKNFVSILTDIRMNRAKELIAENKTITIEELTAQCGYTSKTYFCSLFRKTTGFTVSEYQRQVNHEK